MFYLWAVINFLVWSSFIKFGDHDKTREDCPDIWHMVNGASRTLPYYREDKARIFLPQASFSSLIAWRLKLIHWVLLFGTLMRSKWCPEAETTQKSSGRSSCRVQCPEGQQCRWVRTCVAAASRKHRASRQQRHSESCGSWGMARPVGCLPMDSPHVPTCPPSHQFCEHLLLLKKIPFLPNLTSTSFNLNRLKNHFPKTNRQKL